jgi:hypothetical protein
LSDSEHFIKQTRQENTHHHDSGAWTNACTESWEFLRSIAESEISESNHYGYTWVAAAEQELKEGL